MRLLPCINKMDNRRQFVALLGQVLAKPCGIPSFPFTGIGIFDENEGSR
jgi:hypothetical protein